MIVARSLDFETTGAPVPIAGNKNPENHAVIEGGWCDVILDDVAARVPDDADRGRVMSDISTGAQILEPVSELVNPGRDIDIEALAVHHIQPIDLEGKRTPDRMFMTMNSPRPNYWIAHNAEFEQTFFNGGEDAKWCCTFKTALRVWPEAPSHKLQVLRYWLNIDAEPDFERDLALRPHRAPDDAYVAAFIFRRLLKEIDIETMLRWSKGPALLSRLTFGQYFGEFWKDVAAKDAKYLKWIIESFDPLKDRNTIATAKYHLKLLQQPSTTKATTP